MSGWKIVALDAQGLGAHAAQWDALNERAAANHPLLGSAFVDGLLRCFGTGRERLAILEQEGRAEAMCLLRPRSALVWVSFLPSQAQIAPTLIMDPQTLPGLAAALPWPAMQLDLLCNDPLVGGVLDGRPGESRRMNHALTMQVVLTGGFEHYWEERSKKLRSNIRRYEQRLQADGIVCSYRSISEGSEIDAAVLRYSALERRGWKGQHGTSLASNDAQMRFYADLMADAARSGSAMVCELWAGDTLAASRLIVNRGGVLVMLKTTYNEELARYAPGRLLLKEVIAHLFASHPGQRIEFYTDATTDQLAWATGQRWIQHATLQRHGWLSSAFEIVRALRHASPLPGGPAAETRETAVSIERVPHPDRLPADARALFERTGAQNIELGLDWYRNLIDTVYADDPSIVFYVLRHDDCAVAVLPLRLDRSGNHRRIHSLSNFYTALYEPALAVTLKPRDLLPLLTALKRDFRGAGSMWLAPMDPHSHAYHTLVAGCQLAGWVPFEFFGFGNWYLRVAHGWPDYLRTRSGSVRSTIKRMSKKLGDAQGRLQLITDRGDVPAALKAYEDVYAASWKQPEPHAHFVPGLLEMCADRGWLRMGLVWLEGRAIAAQIWIVAHGRAEIYKVAYDEAYKAYSPGTLLTALLMEHVLEKDRVTEVDYLIGDDAYKKTWMSDRRERWGIVAYNPANPRGFLALLREMIARNLKPVVQRLRAWLASRRTEKI